MHTVKLKIEDDIYQNIMFVLKNLKIKGLQIEEMEKIEETSTANSAKADIRELFENKNVELFASIDDPMLWQKKQREEW